MLHPPTFLCLEVCPVVGVCTAVHGIIARSRIVSLAVQAKQGLQKEKGSLLEPHRQVYIPSMRRHRHDRLVRTPRLIRLVALGVAASVGHRKRAALHYEINAGLLQKRLRNTMQPRRQPPPSPLDEGLSFISDTTS